MYIDRAVGSVLSQTCTDIELILVDDCSADRSSEKCDAWAKMDQRVRAFHLPENGGAGRARPDRRFCEKIDTQMEKRNN